MICYQDYYLQKGFHVLGMKKSIFKKYFLIFSSYLAIFLSISLLGFTLFVYAYFKELRDFHGKTVIALTSSQILAYTAIPILRHLSSQNFSHRSLTTLLISMLIISLVVILLWITVMIVHMFFTFR